MISYFAAATTVIDHAMSARYPRKRTLGVADQYPLCANHGHLPGYSITSSAPARKVAGMVRPKALAVLRLITSSNCVGCRTAFPPGLNLSKSVNVLPGLAVHPAILGP